MKHILEYKNYINLEELKENLNYMFLDLSDEHFKLTIWWDNWVFKEDSIDLEIYKKDKSLFEFSDNLVVYIVRVNEFLSDMGFFNFEGIYYAESELNKLYKTETKFRLRLRDEQLIDYNYVVLNESSNIKTNKIKLKFNFKKLNT